MKQHKGVEFWYRQLPFISWFIKHLRTPGTRRHQHFQQDEVQGDAELREMKSWEKIVETPIFNYNEYTVSCKSSYIQ